MELELKKLLTYFSSTNYDEGYVDEDGKFAYRHKKLPITDAVFDGHLNGKPIGVNTSLDDKGRTKAVVFDIDCKQDDEATRRDDIFAKLTAALKKDSVPFLTFKSGSGNGYHMRPIILNGIDPTVSKNDLVSRIVPINLLPFDGEFVNKKIITERFIAARPRLLHALLTLCSRVRPCIEPSVRQGAHQDHTRHHRQHAAIARYLPGLHGTHCPQQSRYA